MTDQVVPESKDLLKAFETFVALTQKTDALQSKLIGQQAEIGVLREKLQQMEQLKSDVILMDQEFCDVEDLVDSELKSFRSALRDAEQKYDRCISETAPFETRLRELRSSLEQSEKGFNDGLQRVMDHLYRLESQSIKSYDFEKYCSQHEERDQKTVAEIKDIKKRCDSHDFSLTVFKDMLLDHSEALLQARKNSDSLVADYSQKFKDLSIKFSAFSDQLQAKLGAFSEKLGKDIDACKEQIKISPNSVQDLRQEISNTVQICSLDASNAVLKAANAEQQFRILDRKLENINQLLKKLELTK